MKKKYSRKIYFDNCIEIWFCRFSKLRAVCLVQFLVHSFSRQALHCLRMGRHIMRNVWQTKKRHEFFSFWLIIACTWRGFLSVLSQTVCMCVWVCEWAGICSGPVCSKIIRWKRANIYRVHSSEREEKSQREREKNSTFTHTNAQNDRKEWIHIHTLTIKTVLLFSIFIFDNSLNKLNSHLARVS